MTTSPGSTSSSRSSSSSTCSLIVSVTSSRTGGPNRRRASSRSSDCRRSSSRSSSTSRSALRVTRNACTSATSMPANSSPRCAAMRSSTGRKTDPGLVGGHVHQARHVVGHLDPGEPLGAALRIAHGDREVEREPGDVGERVRGVDRERGEHREDLGEEVLREPAALVVGRGRSSAGSGCPARRAPGRRASRNTRACALGDGLAARRRCGPAARAGRGRRRCGRRGRSRRGASARPPAPCRTRRGWTRRSRGTWPAPAAAGWGPRRAPARGR